MSFRGLTKETNLRMKNRDKAGRKGISGCVIFLLATVFLISGGLLVHGLVEDAGSRMTYDRLAARFSGEGQDRRDAGKQTGTWMDKEGQPGQKADRSLEPDPGQSQVYGEQDGAGSGWAADWETRRRVYQELYRENPDLAGWIRIEGTRIDYPVVQSKDRPGFYLDHDFYGKESRSGTPYLAEECSLGEPGQGEPGNLGEPGQGAPGNPGNLGEPAGGLLLYGHHMKNGEMFAALNSYTDQDFYQEHKLIRFDTLDGPGLYEVAAVVRLSASAQNQTLPWQQLLMPESEKERTEAWERFERERLYDTGIRLEPEDKILCLVTCEYTLEDGRLMVVARRKQGIQDASFPLNCYGIRPFRIASRWPYARGHYVFMRSAQRVHRPV